MARTVKSAKSFTCQRMQIDDVDNLFNAQNQSLHEHVQMALPYFATTMEGWKTVFGYPADDAKRLTFVRDMPAASTKHGEALRCIKLLCSHNKKTETAGFVEFEITPIKDTISGTVREIHIRNLVVRAQMRRQGCAQLLYNAMLEYVGATEIAVLRLTVVDLNLAALGLYFKLGFKITQVYVRNVANDKHAQILLLNMQKLVIPKQDPATGKTLPICRQPMPHMFKDEVVGQSINIICNDDRCPGRTSGSKITVDARIADYEPSSRLFTIEYASAKAAAQKLCANDLYSRGLLSFKKPLSLLLRELRSDPIGESQNRAEAETTSKPRQTQKRAREPSTNRCTHLLRRGKLNVFEDGKLHIGFEQHELGLVVHTLDGPSVSQPGVKKGDVIVAVGGRSLLKCLSDNGQDERCKQERRSIIAEACAAHPKAIQVFLGSLDKMLQHSLDEVCLELDHLLAKLPSSAA